MLDSANIYSILSLHLSTDLAIYIYNLIWPARQSANSSVVTASFDPGWNDI